MSFRSVDMQVVLQRSPDVGKIQHVQQQQAQNEMQHNTSELRQRFENRESSVNEVDYLEKNNIRDDNPNKKRKDKKNKKTVKENKDADNFEENILPHLGKNLDLHI